MSDSAATPATSPEPAALLNASLRAKILLIGATAAGFALGWWAGYAFDIPVYRDLQASLLQQPTPVQVLLIVALACAAVAIVASAIGGTVRFDAGLLAAAAALAALSARGGTSRDVLFWASAQHPNAPAWAFLKLVIELSLLGLIMFGLWTAAWRFRDRGMLKGRLSDPAEPEKKDGDPLAASLITQVVLMGLVALALATTVRKTQVMAAVGFGAYFGTAIAYYRAAPRFARYAWVGPVAVGIIGYIAGALSPAGWELGMVGEQNALAPLTRPLPLDYAGVGIGGALLGLWGGRGFVRTFVDLAAGFSHLGGSDKK